MAETEPARQPDQMMGRSNTQSEMLNRQSSMSRSQMIRTLTVEDVGKSSMYVMHPTTYTETLMNVIRVYIGNGLFAMPYAFKSTGLYFGIFLVTVFMIATIYCNQTLIYCCEEVKKRHKMTRSPDMSETVYLSFISGPRPHESFASIMRKCVSIFIVIMQFLICCVTIVFVGSSFKLLLETYNVPKVSIAVYLAVVTIPMLLTALIKELKYLAPISFVANILLCIGTFIVLYVLCEKLPSLKSRPAITPVTEMPLFFGTFLFAVAGISLTIPFRSQMMVPEHFESPLGVLNVAMFIYGTLLILLGFFGFLKFGNAVKGSIILNLPPTKIIVQVVQLALALSIMFSYALQFYLVHLLVYSTIDERFGPFESDLFEVFIRICLVLLTLLCAEVMPNLGLFISLSGALSCSALLFLFPQISDIALRWPSEFGCLAWRLVIDVLLIISCFICSATGVYVSIYSFIKQL